MHGAVAFLIKQQLTVQTALFRILFWLWSVNRANAGACAAVDAGISIDNISCVSLRDSANRAL